MSNSKSVGATYSLNKFNDKQTFKNSDVHKEKQILNEIFHYMMKERKPSYKKLLSFLENSNLGNPIKEEEITIQNKLIKKQSNIVQYLEKKGYINNKKNWLTKKGFYKIGNLLLNELIKNTKNNNYGFHNTTSIGQGNNIFDTTKKIEVDDDFKNIDVQNTIFNSVVRSITKTKTLELPIILERDDFEQYETHKNIQNSIVYCLDLSSTMNQMLSKNTISKIESAKKGLWILSALNKKFYPPDNIYIIGFATIALIIPKFSIHLAQPFEIDENFLQYTNFQAALRLGRKILHKDSSDNKKIILITDGHPTACYIDDENHKSELLLADPYSNFYNFDKTKYSKLEQKYGLKVNYKNADTIFFRYRYNAVEPIIENRTMYEAKKCIREGIEINTILLETEPTIVEYVRNFEKKLEGKLYQIKNDNFDKTLINDYLSKK